MSYSPPEPPSPERKPLDFDEFVAVVVAFISIGLILLWGLTRKATQIGATAWPLLGTQPQAETAPRVEASSDQPAEISALEGSQSPSPFRIFQIPPDTPGNFAEFGPAELLGVPQGEQQPPISRRTIGSYAGVSEAGGLPRQTAPSIPIQPNGDGFDGFDLDGGETPILGDDLPNLPAQPPLDSTELTEMAPLAAPLEFSDVTDQHWAKDFIDALSARGLLSGFPDGAFQPDKPATRAELAAQIAKVFMLEPGGNALIFDDISAVYWAASEIDKAVTAGFMRGYPEGDFRPNQDVSRVEVLAAIVSSLGLPPNSEPTLYLRRYTDRGDIPGWAIAKVATATELGLVVNYPNLERLQPNKPATRAEVAALLNRALVHLGQLDDSPSGYVVRP